MILEREGLSEAQHKLAAQFIDALLVASAILTWLGSHVFLQAAGLLGTCYLVVAIIIGLRNETLGLCLAIITVPFTGTLLVMGNGDFGVLEFMRSAPIWGALIRTVTRFLRPGWSQKNFAEMRLRVFITGAALVAIFLAPLTRITAQHLYALDQTGLLTDMLGILGTQSIFWATWILAANSKDGAVTHITTAVTVSTIIAVLLSLLAWVGIINNLTILFPPEVFGRLSTLGFPTPTGMGLAIALPVAIAALYKVHRPSAFLLTSAGVASITLTQSRGAFIAFSLALVIYILASKTFPRKLLIAATVTLAIASVGLLLIRYGDELNQILAGQLPDFLGDRYRVESWIAAFPIALSSPLTGGGWASIAHFNDGYFDARGIGFSHNMILQALSDGGFPLGAAVGAGLIGSTLLIWKQRKVIHPAWIAAAIAIMVSVFWDLPQIRAYASLYGGLALGMASRPWIISGLSSTVDNEEKG